MQLKKLKRRDRNGNTSINQKARYNMMQAVLITTIICVTIAYICTINNKKNK